MKDIDVEDMIKKALVTLMILGGMTTFAVVAGQIASCNKASYQEETTRKAMDDLKPPTCKDEVSDWKHSNAWKACDPGATVEVQGDIILCHCPHKTQ